MKVQYNILIVDDSAVNRKQLREVLATDEKCHVVDFARNGQDALDKVVRLRPEVVVMSVDLFGMGGLATLQQMMKIVNIPVIMLSSSHSAQQTIEALEAGAVDCFSKEDLFQENNGHYVFEFIARLKAVARQKQLQDPPVFTFEMERTIEPINVELIVIGSSTGGPSALQHVLEKMSGNLCPVVILQHMPKGFTEPLATRFNERFAQIVVKEAEQREWLQPGHVYIGPAGYQTDIIRKEGKLQFKIGESRDDELYKPSIDHTLVPLASVVKDGLLVVILTGMGNDGTKGCKEVKENGGRVIVEAESSCVVYGMPRSVFEAGYADRQAPVQRIYNEMMKLISLKEKANQ